MPGLSVYTSWPKPPAELDTTEPALGRSASMPSRVVELPYPSTADPAGRVPSCRPVGPPKNGMLGLTSAASPELSSTSAKSL